MTYLKFYQEKKMKGKNYFQWMLVICCSVLLVAVLAACGGQPPTAEVDAANAAMQEAIAAGAEQFAQDELKAAQDLMARLTSEMDSKDYKAAKETAVQVKEAAEKAKAAIETGKVTVKENAEALVNEVKAGLETAKGMVAEAEAGKMAAEALQPLKDQLAAAEAGVAELDGMIAAEQYKEATDKANQAKEIFAQIEQGISSAKGGE